MSAITAKFLVKNFASLAGAEVLSKLVTFAAFAFLARLLGPGDFGFVEWAGAVFMCASLIVDQGFSHYGAREIAKDPAKTGSLVSEIVTTRVLLAFVGYLAILLFATAAVENRDVVRLLLVYGIGLWGLPFLLLWVFQGHDLMRVVAITQVIRQTVFAIVVFGFVRGGEDLIIVGLAELAGISAAAAFSVIVYLRGEFESVSIRPALSLKLLRDGVPIGLSQLFWVVKTFGATLLIGLIATAEETGVFAGAMRIYIALHTFVWLYYFNLLPSMSRAWEDGGGEFSRLIWNSMMIVVLVSLLGGIAWFWIAPYLMTGVFGEGFLVGGNTLRWLGAVCIVAAVSGHYRFGLIAAGRQGLEMFSSAAGAVIAAIAVPVGYFYLGLSGAASGLFFAECVILLVSGLMAAKVLFGKSAAGPTPSGAGV